MFLLKPLSATISMVILLSSLAVFSVLGNGFILGILARFKKLRTYPNVLIANLALVDTLNALINMPVYMLYAVLEVSWFKGKTLAIFSLFQTRLFTLLNLTSMLLLLVNIFLALTFDLKYFVWKTNKKAFVVALVEWFICLAAVSLSCLPIFDIDLQDAHVFIYRRVMFNNNKTYLATSMAVFIVCTIVFGSLVVHSVRRKKLQRKQLNLPQLQEEARIQMDIKAAKNVVITILAFLMCYIPPILFAVWGRPRSGIIRWPGFLTQFSIFMSSGINPFIYCFRNRRFRSALKQLLKDPCGKSPFQETKQKQRARQNIPCQNTRQAAARNKIACEPQTSLVPTARVLLVQRIRYPTAIQEECGRRQRDCEEEDSNRNELTQSSGLRTSDDVMPISLQEQESNRVAKLAWVENHHTASVGTSSREERPTPSADYTRQEVTVEVHTDPNDTPPNQEEQTSFQDYKVAQEAEKGNNKVAKLVWVENHHTDSVGTSSREERPTSSADYTRQEVTVEVHSDPNNTSPNQEEQTSFEDYKVAQEAEKGNNKEQKDAVHADAGVVFR